MRKAILIMCSLLLLCGCQAENEEASVSVWEEGMNISGVTTSDESSLIEEKPASEQHESSDSDASAIAKSIQNSVNDSMAKIVEAGFLKGYTYTYEPDKKAVDVITKSCSKTSDPTKCYVESVMSAKDELDNSDGSSAYAYTYKASSAVVKTVREGCEGAEDPTQCYIDLSMAKKQALSVPETAASKTGTASVPVKTNVTAKVLKEGCEASDNPNQCYINQVLAASTVSQGKQLASVESSQISGSKTDNSGSNNVSDNSSVSNSGKTGCEASDNPTQCYIDQANAKRTSNTGTSSGKDCREGFFLTDDGRCEYLCGDEEHYENGQCVSYIDPSCGPGFVIAPNDACMSIAERDSCSADPSQEMCRMYGYQAPVTVVCKEGFYLTDDGRCEYLCGDEEHYANGKCVSYVDPQCGPGFVIAPNDACMTIAERDSCSADSSQEMCRNFGY